MISYRKSENEHNKTQKIWKNTFLAWRFKWKKTWKCWYFSWKNKFSIRRIPCFWWKSAKMNIQFLRFLSKYWPPQLSWFWSFLLSYYKIKKNEKFITSIYWKNFESWGGQYLVMKHLFFCIFFRKKYTSCYCEFVFFCFFGKNTFFNGFYALQMFKIINFLSFFHKKFVFFCTREHR